MAMDPLTWLSLVGSTPTPPPTGAFPPAPPLAVPTPGAQVRGLNQFVPPSTSPFGVPGADIANMPTLGASLAGAQYQAPGTTAGSVGGNVAALPGRGGIGSDYAASQRTGGGGGGGGGGEQAVNRTSLQGGGGGTGDKLRDTLRGVSAPKAPEAQYVRTPPPPQIAPIRGGEFLQLLTSLGIGPQEFMRLRTGGR